MLSENMGNHPTEEGPNPILCRVLQDHHLSNLLPQALREDLAAGESWRIRYKRKADVLNVETFLDFVRSLPGPRMRTRFGLEPRRHHDHPVHAAEKNGVFGNWPNHSLTQRAARARR